MMSFSQKSTQDKNEGKKSYVYTEKELLDIIKRYDEAARPILEKR